MLEGERAYSRVRNSSTLLAGRLVTRGRRPGDEEKGRSIGKRLDSIGRKNRCMKN